MKENQSNQILHAVHMHIMVFTTVVIGWVYNPSCQHYGMQPSTAWLTAQPTKLGSSYAKVPLSLAQWKGNPSVLPGCAACFAPVVTPFMGRFTFLFAFVLGLTELRSSWIARPSSLRCLCPHRSPLRCRAADVI